MFEGFVERVGVYVDFDVGFFFGDRYLIYLVGGFVYRYNYISVYKVLEFGFDCIFV